MADLATLKTKNRVQQQVEAITESKTDAFSEYQPLVCHEFDEPQNGIRSSFNNINVNSVRPASVSIQPKLMINQPGDIYEQEADAMADKVLRMTDAAPGQLRSASNTIQRKCAHCEEEEEKKKKIQRKGNGSGEFNASNDLSRYVKNLGSSGTPLSKEERNFFEPRFGFDFSKVRIHSDTVASESARSINAQAYTYGYNITFNSGQYNPNSISGKKLLAHELAHVLQQNRNTDDVQDTAGAETPYQIYRQPAPASTDANAAPPFYGMSAAPDSFHGIELYYNVKTLPDSDHTAQTFNRGPYLIAPNLLRNADGTSSIEYYVAFRKEPGLIGPTNWNEYIIGPDSIQEFLNNLHGYAAAGAMGYMFGPPAPNAIEGAQFVQNVMAGRFKEAGKAYGRSLYESIKDPGWWIQILSAFASLPAEGGGVPRPGLPEAPISPNVTPRLTVITGGAKPAATVVGRVSNLAFETEGSAARAINPAVTPAPVAPPVKLVPPPPAVTPVAPAAAPAVVPGPLIPPKVAAMAVAVISATAPKTGSSISQSPRTQPAQEKKTKDNKRKSTMYPIYWPVLLGPPLSPIFIKVKSPERNFDDDNQEALKAKRVREKDDPDFTSTDYHIHHMTPLFLGGEDKLQSPSKGGNGAILRSFVHIEGHNQLRKQPQMQTPPVPLAPLSDDIYQHPNGTEYYLAGFKTGFK